MNIIVKYLLKNILEKKMRTFLIVLAIILSSGVFFASIAVSGSLMKMFTEAITGLIGNADIMITQSEKSPSEFMSTARAERYKEKLEYIIGQMNGSAIYTANHNEEISLSLKGVSLEDLQKMYNCSLEKQGNLYPFEGKKIIINRNMSEKYGIGLGSILDLKFGKDKHRFTVCAIASPNGAFAKEGEALPAVVPKDALESVYNAKGRSNIIYIKLLNPLDKQQVIENLSDEYKNYHVSEPFPFEMLQRETSGISAVFLMLSCIVFFMSIFIIYSSFKVITTERLPVIGTLRSIGATKRTTNAILLGESILYGIMGGILGCGVGIAILYIMTWALSKMASSDADISFNVTLNYSVMNFVSAFLAAVVLCFISSIVPIFKASRIPIKDIILNFIQKTKKSSKLRLILGILFMAISFALSTVKSDQLRPVCGGLGMLLVLTALVLLVPYFTKLFILLFEKLYLLIFGNIGTLAAKNLRDNKSIINNISMLAIGISSLLLFNTASYDQVISIIDTYKNTLYDLEMSIGRTDKGVEHLIQNVDGVKGVYKNYMSYQVEVIGQNDKISSLYGIDINDFLNYFKLDMEGNPSYLFKSLEDGRNIMLTKELGNTFKVKAGDTLILKTKDGEKTYTVVGFFNNLMNSKNCALISQRFYKMDLQTQDNSYTFYIKTYKNPEEVIESIKKEFKRWNPNIQTKEHIRQQQLDNNKKSVMLMQGFSILALIIAIFGIINNLLISFIERKHSLAVFRSMGMSKKQTAGMMFIESLTGGIIGGGLGILGSILMITVLAGVNESSQIHYPVYSFLGYLASGAAIMLVASISPALKSSKLDIVSTIKFE